MFRGSPGTAPKIARKNSPMYPDIQGYTDHCSAFFLGGGGGGEGVGLATEAGSIWETCCVSKPLQLYFHHRV